MRVIILVAFLVGLSGTANAAVGVYQCTDDEVAGIIWEKKSSRSTSFDIKRHSMKILLSGTRIISSEGGAPFAYTCTEAWKGLENSLIRCSSSVRTWLFRGDRYTFAFLYGQNLGGEPNLYISHGSCTKP